MLFDIFQLITNTGIEHDQKREIDKLFELFFLFVFMSLLLTYFITLAILNSSHYDIQKMINV